MAMLHESRQLYGRLDTIKPAAHYNITHFAKLCI